jgi:hypothetical protein
MLVMETALRLIDGWMDGSINRLVEKPNFQFDAWHPQQSIEDWLIECRYRVLHIEIVGRDQEQFSIHDFI